MTYREFLAEIGPNYKGQQKRAFALPSPYRHELFHRFVINLTSDVKHLCARNYFRDKLQKKG